MFFVNSITSSKGIILSIRREAQSSEGLSSKDSAPPPFHRTLQTL